MSGQSPGVGLSLQVMIPDLLTRYPQTRAVLDRYGLRGGGGPSGPNESLHAFARTHGIDERTLMDELRHAIATSAQHAGGRMAVGVTPRLADAIYRPYFLGGITIVLTAGAVWGAWLLWRIGVAGDFHQASIHEVNAHGHAQIFGWVGLFIMGFALQVLPRLWQVELPAPRAALGAFVAMVLGIVVRTAGMTAAGEAWALPAAMAGGLVECAAIALVVGILLAAFARSAVRMEPYIAFVLAGLGWFVIQAVFSLWHTWMTMTALAPGDLLWYVATYQSPLRDMQIHGLALFMILGVSIRMLPAMFGLPRVGDRRAWLAFALLLVGVVGEVVLFIAYRWTGSRALTGGLLGAWVLVVAGVLLVALPWKLWRPLPTHDRSANFIRAAYGWLLVALAMLLLLPVYLWGSGLPFSHAYYGATRHAITVGFISLMIMGIAAKVVPALRGWDARTLTRLWLPFALVNVGCLLRVSTQTLTDWHPAFFGVIGISGTLEVTGLALWGGHLMRLMCTQSAKQVPVPGAAPVPGAGVAPGAAPGAGARPSRIEPGHTVADVLAWFPHALGVFEQAGFTMLSNPAVRRAMAHRVTVAQVAAMRGVDISELIAKMNSSIPSAPASALRYDAPLRELVEAAPAAAAVLRQHGLKPDSRAELTLGEALAQLDEATRERLMAQLAQATANGSRQGEACANRCENCDNRGQCNEPASMESRR